MADRTTTACAYAVRCSATRTWIGRAPESRFNADFQELHHPLRVGEVWTRPGLDRRTRSVVTLTALIAHGHWEELAHARAAARAQRADPDEIGEVILQSAIYCGVPVANHAFAVAKKVLDSRGDR